MNTQVTFNISEFPDLLWFAEQLKAFEAGTISSICFKEIQSAMCELQTIERTCMEVEPAMAQ
jgi:hypothetical protein